MDTIKAGRPLIELVKLCRAADTPLLLVVGGHGVGKSELLGQSAGELGIKYLVRDLSIMEATDLTGLPRAKGAATTYLPPEFLPRSDQGLLVFEELNRAERHVRAPCLELLTARRLNDYVLPPGWLPLAAVNPADGGDYHVDDLDPALASRFVQVRVVPDRTEWLAWARRAGVHAAVLAYVEADASVFDRPESNPRAWKRVSDLLRAAAAVGSDPAIVRAAVFGQVGDARGKAFLASLKKVDRPLAAADVLHPYPKHRDQVRRWAADGRLDLLEATAQKVCLHVQPEADYLAVRQAAAQWRNVGRFLDDLPGDLQDGARAVFTDRGYDVPPRPRQKPAGKGATV